MKCHFGRDFRTKSIHTEKSRKIQKKSRKNSKNFFIIKWLVSLYHLKRYKAPPKFLDRKLPILELLLAKFDRAKQPSDKSTFGGAPGATREIVALVTSIVPAAGWFNPNKQ